MHALKIFIAIVIATIVYLLILINYRIVVNKRIKNVYKDDNSNSLDNNIKFTVIDNNEIELKGLIESYCNVRVIKNVTHNCLQMLKKYDLSKLSVEYKSRDNRTDEKIYYHTFWDPDDGRPHHANVMNLNILSFLATQDIKRAKFIIWSRQNLEIFKEFKIRYEKYIKNDVLNFRLIDLKKFCSVGIFIKRVDVCKELNFGGGSIIHYSDFVRFLVLNTYGGIYVDGDVIFLRDMKYFWDKNFVYRWSFTESYNTAIMGLRKEHGNKVEKIYADILNNSPHPHALMMNFYPTNIKNVVSRINNKNIYDYEDFNVYSSVLFDPAWLCFDTQDCIKEEKTIRHFKDFYDATINETEFKAIGFFPGAFTYHLHLSSCGTCKVRQDTFFLILKVILNQS